MDGWLKQSTLFTLRIGPFVDATDGDTAETGLTVANTDVRLSKAGAAFGAKNSGGGTHDENGFYWITLDTTDTNTLGLLKLACKISGALRVWHDFIVLPANIFDSLVAGSDKLEVDLVQWLGTAAAAPTVAGVPEVDVTHWRGTATPAEHTAGHPIVTVKDGTGTGEINTNAGKVVGVELVDTLTTYTGNTPQTGDVFPLASTEIADIKAKTDNLPSDPADQSLIIAATDTIMSRLGTPAGSSVSADIAGVQADTDNIQTRLPAALVSGRMDSLVGAMAADVMTATATDATYVTELAAALKTQVDTALTDIHLDHLLAADYDPANKPGAATALLNELIESDAGVSQFTANALEEALSGGGGGSSAADIWAYSPRTLTQSAAAIAAVLAGSNIIVSRGTTWSIALTNIGVLTNYNTVYFTVKAEDSLTDTQALLQVYNHATEGLLRFNGSAPVDDANGKIVIDDAPTGDITITVQEEETASAPLGTYYYDIKGVDDNGNVDLISSGGIFTVTPDITRAIVSPGP